MNVGNDVYSPLIAGGIVVPPKKESELSTQDIAGGIVVPPSSEANELQEDVVELSR